MGGGAAGWRNVAIVYGLIGLVVNTISVLSVKEVPDEEEKVQTSAEKGGEDKLSLWESAKLLFANKYYLIIVAVYVLILYSDWHCGHRYLLYDLCAGQSRFAGNLFRGADVPDDYRPGIYSLAGEKSKGNV